MRRLRFLPAVLIGIAVICYACEKVPVDSKIFVERYLTGTSFTRWPIQSYVKLELNGKDTLAKETIDLAIDTAIFNINSKYIRGTDTVNFAVDQAGENITFSTKPDSTWHIEYLRNSSFKLVHQRNETVNGVTTNYKIEQIFRK
ncbi:hypothetical protein [Pedobacter sp.]